MVAGTVFALTYGSDGTIFDRCLVAGVGFLAGSGSGLLVVGITEFRKRGGAETGGNVDKPCRRSDECCGGRPMREILQLPFTCHSCQHAFSVRKVDLDKNEPIYCPKCSAMFRLKSEQMKGLAPGRKPVRD
jgi:hypothetical protein